MTRYRLERVSAVDLVFDGELLAETTTEAAGAERWQEVRVYRTDSARWIIERTGQSRVEGEVTRTRASVCDTVDEVRRAITYRRPDNPERAYVTDVAYDAVLIASELDPRLSEALVEHV